MFCLTGACFAATLYLRRQFTGPELNPLIYNGFIILCGLLLPFSGMEGFCWGVSIGAFLGAFILPWIAVRQGGGLHMRIQWRHPLILRFLIIALPLMLGQFAVMLNEQFLRIFGSYAGDGVVSLLSYARRISQVPVGMIGQAAAVASYPFLAMLVAQKDLTRFDQTLRTAITNSLLLLIPFSCWMGAAAWPVLCFIFQGGQFEGTHTLASVPLLQIMLMVVPLWAVQMLLGRAFYAHGDTLTPAIWGTLVTIVSVPLFLYWAVPRGALGIAWLSSLTVLCYTLLLALLWWRRFGGAAFAGVGRLAGISFFLSLPATFAAWYVARWIMLSYDFAPVLLAFVACMCSGLLFAALYAFIARTFCPVLLAPVMSRLRR